LKDIKLVNRVNNHWVRLALDSGESIILKNDESEKVARIDFKMDDVTTIPYEYKGKIVNIPVVMADKSQVLNLPEQQQGVFNIVSTMVADFVKRPDCLSPDTTADGIIQNGREKVWAVRRLQCFTEMPDWFKE
jgi:hypothetical protein